MRLTGSRRRSSPSAIGAASQPRRRQKAENERSVAMWRFQVAGAVWVHASRATRSSRGRRSGRLAARCRASPEAAGASGCRSGGLSWRGRAGRGTCRPPHPPVGSGRAPAAGADQAASQPSSQGMRRFDRMRAQRDRRWLLTSGIVMSRGMVHSPRHPTNRLGRPTRSLAADNRAEHCRLRSSIDGAAAAARKLTAGPCPSIRSPVGASRFWRKRGKLPTVV